MFPVYAYLFSAILFEMMNSDKDEMFKEVSFFNGMYAILLFGVFLCSIT